MCLVCGTITVTTDPRSDRPGDDRPIHPIEDNTTPVAPVTPRSSDTCPRQNVNYRGNTKMCKRTFCDNCETYIRWEPVPEDAVEDELEDPVLVHDGSSPTANMHTLRINNVADKKKAAT
eukprot:6467494-Heterocapsa_arctica.AAC.1